MARIELDNMTKAYGSTPVVHEIALAVEDREFVVFVGPSGCGKSTILRMIAGLEDITSGELRIAGVRMNEAPSRRRNLAMVFQDYALYPHMTVAANISFGLRMQGAPRAERAARVAEVARMLQLDGLLERKPRTLSGGQRQRVAMGRALARRASAFLFDEPLSNLDAKLRLEVRTQIRLLHREFGMTSVFVTHDQTEAMTLADRIVCLDAGRIAQMGAPEELYDRPATVFVAGFIGAPQINLLEATVEAGPEGGGGAPVARLADGQTLPLPPGAPPPGRRILVGLRPEDLTDNSRQAGLARPAVLRVEGLLVETLGSDSFVIGRLAGAQVTARCRPGLRGATGAPILLQADAARTHLFDPESGRRLAGPETWP